MSNLDRTPGLTRTGGLSDVAPRPVHEFFAGREVLLSGGPPASDGVAGGGESTKVRRLLPNLGRRLVGPWCFVDHYGPEDVSVTGGMNVPPHPHIGLQTVSWLLDGEVHHRDSLGSDQIVRPGQLGLMTAGAGIAHAEHSPVPRADLLHGVQLWVALPDSSRAVAPSWEHHATLPVLSESGATATVIMGSLAGATSPGTSFAPMVGADIAIETDALLPLEPEFEYALLAMSGTVEVENAVLDVGTMLYLGCGRRDLRLRADAPARVLLLGGVPFEEQIVMWWNFVGRSNEEIAAAREAWMNDAGFGVVTGAGERLPAPPMPAGRLRPGGRER